MSVVECREPSTKVRRVDVMFVVKNPAVDMTALGVCIQKDTGGVVMGRCPIVDLPLLSIGINGKGDICARCTKEVLNAIQRTENPSPPEYSSTGALKKAIRDDLNNIGLQ